LFCVGCGEKEPEQGNAPEIKLQEKTITESGEYTADTGFDGIGKVTVEVTGSGGSSADVRYVTFMSYDGLIEYGKKAVAVGDDCADPIARDLFATPTRESDEQYNYTFYGWATELDGAAVSNWNKAITEDKTVYACFSRDGSCGDSVHWSLPGNEEVLTISGSGAMTEFASLNAQPWGYARKSIKTIVINAGVTTIGPYAFDGFSSLTNITIPTSVTTIGTSAFSSCTALKKISIPSGVNRINVRAFESSGLTSATFAITTGWTYVQLGTPYSISSTTLSNSSSAASQLKSLTMGYMTRS
jgi:hypothetical protein